MSKAQTLSLIIPAYNEETRLDPFLKSIEIYSGAGAISEIIIVDDGSSDQTVKVANKFASSLPIHVIRHSNNQGKGAAIRTGVLASHFETIVFMDADGATPISELPKMISALKNAQIAIGNRWMKGSKTTRHSQLRKLSGWVYRTYLKLFGLGHIDTMCGFKGFKQPVAEKLFSNLIEERWLFDTEIAYRATKAQFNIKNVPINWESKDGSKLDTKTLIVSALHILPLILKINRSLPNT